MEGRAGVNDDGWAQLPPPCILYLCARTLPPFPCIVHSWPPDSTSVSLSLPPSLSLVRHWHTYPPSSFFLFVCVCVCVCVLEETVNPNGWPVVTEESVCACSTMESCSPHRTPPQAHSPLTPDSHTVVRPDNPIQAPLSMCVGCVFFLCVYLFVCVCVRLSWVSPTTDCVGLKMVGESRVPQADHGHHASSPHSSIL